MLGKRDPQRDLFGVENLLLDHVGKNSFYAYLCREGSKIFRDEEFSELYGAKGRPSVPPSQLCVLMVLQYKHDVSDHEAVERAAFDIRWKVALGVEIEDRLCAKSTLQLFRSKLLLNERYLKLFEASVAACQRNGLGKSKGLEVAIDTTPVLGRGAVRDTYNLVSDGIRLVVKEACDLKGWDIDGVVDQAGLSRHFGSSFKGESELDWTDKGERRALLAQLVADAQVAIQLGNKALNGHAADAESAAALFKARGLLKDLLVQDVDEEPDDGGGPTIRRGTKRDRIISTSDPDMRHGHKSHSKGFDGFKASVVVDTKDGVVLATDARRANVADREDAKALVEAAGSVAGAAVKTVLGDTAYGDMGTRRAMAELDVEVVAKAPPIPSKNGTFKRDVFKVDERRGVATCPAGARSIRRRPPQRGEGWTYTFSRNDCNGCELREKCTTSATGARTITVTENSKELDRHRKKQRTKRFRKRYRSRIAVEHAIGRMRKKGAGQARYFGVGKLAMQMAITAMVVNLGLAARCLHLEAVVTQLRAWIDAHGLTVADPRTP